ncbi:hypothetical protein DPSP01_001993 [Paraphaeosphaeria sporulosa]
MPGNCSGSNNFSSIPAYRPTPEAYVAIPNAYNWSSLLQSCCGSDSLVTRWGEPGDEDRCYLYCNVTVTENHSANSVRQCVRNAILKQDQFVRVTKSTEEKSGAVGRLEWRGGLVGWVVLGVWVVGAVCGVL